MRYTLVPLLLWLITIAVADLRIRKVRNWMVLLGLGTGLATLFSGGQPFQVDAWSGLLGMLAAAAALLPFYALRWMGAGDVKFAAVMGLWFGLSPELLLVWLGGSLLAGLHGMAVLAWRGFRRSPYGPVLQANLPVRWAHVLAMPSAPASNTVQRSIPYAGYMALAAIWLVLARGAP